MVPKIIHYCWFGGSKHPKLMKKCIKSWKRVLPEYELRIWTEDSFDISKSVNYVQEAHQQKKYAFVSDYVRLYALYNYGGVYLDTDVEVLKDFSQLFKTETTFGFEDVGKISTAFIAVEPRAEWIKELLDMYAHRNFILPDGRNDQTTNVEFISKYLAEKKIDMQEDRVEEEHLTIYPIDFFSPKSWASGKYEITNNTYTVHYFAGTWHSLPVRVLSLFFTNEEIVKIASIKEKILRLIKKWIPTYAHKV